VGAVKGGRGIRKTPARLAYREWLGVIPSNRILWGSDVQIAESVDGAAHLTRHCQAEARAELVARGDLRLKASVHGPDGDWSIFRRFQPSITFELVRKHGPIPFSFRPVKGYASSMPNESSTRSSRAKAASHATSPRRSR